MREKIKITVLGGSGVYTPGLVISLMKSIDKLPEINLVLCGRTEKKLEIVFMTADRIARESEGRLKIERTTSVEGAVEGSDIVINQIRAGGFTARAEDESFAETLGIVEEETIGIVGLANALRTIPVVMRYAELIERISPDAWLLNFTNPASMTIRAIKKKTRLKVFGVCDLPEVMTHTIAESIGEERQSMYFQYAGINHLGWITDVIKSGKSVFSRVIEKSGEFNKLGIAAEIVRFTGAVPVPFLKYYYNPDEQIEKAGRKSMTRGDELKKLENELMGAYSDESLRNNTREIKSLLFSRRNPVWYEYCVVPVIISLFGNIHSTHIIMMENNGVVEELDRDDVVEITAYIDENGIKPVKDGVIPVNGRGLLRSVACFERLAVEAVFHPTEENILKALLCHPLVPSLNIAKAALPYLMKQINI